MHNQGTTKILYISFAALLCTSIFSIGHFQADEHFQLLEFAAMKLNLIDASTLPWEYQYQMRSAFQPLIVVAVHKFISAIGLGNPFTITTILRLMSAALSFLSMYLIYWAYRDRYPKEQQTIFSYLSFLLWFAIFVGVRYSSESWSGSLFIIAFALYFHPSQKGIIYFLGIVMIFGLSYLSRYQMCVMVFGFLLWVLFIKKDHFKNFISVVLGIVLAIGFGLIVDYWFYGEWTWSFWHYIDQNVFHDKASNFGLEPWWYYIPQLFLALIPPFSLIPIFLFTYLVIAKPKDVLVWMILPFLLLHSSIGHKELRFLFPLIGFLPVIIMEGYALFIYKRSFDPSSTKLGLIVLRSFFVLNSFLLLFICFTSLDRTTPLYRHVYQGFDGPTTLYYSESNPYQLGPLTYSYYKRPNLNVLEGPDFANLGARFRFNILTSHKTTHYNARKQPI
ncbi:MAG: hypothetical protein IPL46_12665 [Saprospiraceae bacterium]|nr:hypothetical protein [Saprospiraceae bacterium]